MLEFEDEMKAVRKGYVVLSIDEYDSLRDQLAAANMKAFEAEQLANRRIAEKTSECEKALDAVLTVAKRNYGGHEVDIVFNKHSVYTLALRQLHKVFSYEEIENYKVKSASDLLLMDELFAFPEHSAADTTATDTEE